MTAVTITQVQDLAAIGEKWRALEEQADCSFFQSWTWTGCLAEERFPRPVLAEAIDDGETIGLALFNRNGRLYLGETGIAAMDNLAIEHNGPLTLRDRPDAAAAVLRSAARRFDLVLSGVTQPTPGVRVKQQQALFARPDSDWFARRSANTRQQIQRSDRGFAAFGSLAVCRATTTQDAHAWLDEMAELHQATWVARGKPGAFADPFFARFHHALIDRGLPRDEIDLWRVTAGPKLIGILYNFQFRGRVSAYQSGFAYDANDQRLKPGLTCHRAVIEASAVDTTIYDFLAGESRYKQSLADGAETMYWLTAGPWWSPRMLLARARALASARLGVAT